MHLRSHLKTFGYKRSQEPSFRLFLCLLFSFCLRGKSLTTSHLLSSRKLSLIYLAIVICRSVLILSFPLYLAIVRGSPLATIFLKVLSVDSVDISGEQHSSITKEVNKTRVLKDGSGVDSDYNSEKMKALEQKRDRNYCGSCYGAGAEDNQCCNTCESVLEAYRVRGWTIPDPDVFEQCKDEKEAGSLAAINQEGCRLVGQLGVNKVAGSFHIAPGKSYGQGHVHVHDLMAFSGKQFVLDHQIRRLSFGDTYPGQINPLDNTNMSDSTESPMISYFLKLVPTIYSDFSEKPLVTNQYSVTWQVKSTPLTGGSDGIPGVFFNYQISPLLVKLTKERRSFLHFLTNTCAIVGGVYTVASLLDAFVYRSSCFLAKLK